MSHNSGLVQIQVSPPRRFTAPAFVAMALCCLILAVPLLVVAMVVTALPLGPLTLALPLAVLTGGAVLLPLAMGNAVVRHVAKANCDGKLNPTGFVVQLSATPRLQGGLRAVFEDADDVGLLTATESDLVFEGDSARLRIPWNCVEAVARQNVGWRGWFLYGARTVVSLKHAKPLQELEFSERSSWWLPGSRQTARALFNALHQHWQAAQPQADRA